MINKLIIFGALFFILVNPIAADEYLKAHVLSIQEEGETLNLKVQTEKNELVEVEIGGNVFTPQNESFAVGEAIVLNRLDKVNGESVYLFMEKYRLPQIFLIFVIFLTASLFLTRRRGLGALLGLTVSILILTLIIIPLLVAGKPPLVVGLGGSMLIATIAIPLSHRFNKVAFISLGGVLLTLVLASGLAVFAVKFSKLLGFGSESAFSAQFGTLANLDFQGILLASILIGTLGVLDDITSTQAAAVSELRQANHQLGFKQLFQRGLNIGKEHIFAMINTLALAYAGASLPLLLLLSNENLPLWVVLNSQIISEEIIRTLVGSISLIFAVPITTVLAAWIFSIEKKKISVQDFFK